MRRMKIHKSFFSFKKPALMNGGERGTAVLEFAAVLPVLLFIIAGSLECSRMVVDYLHITRTVYEGLRYAAGVPQLKECGSPGVANSCNFIRFTKHSEIRGRVAQLMEDLGYEQNLFGGELQPGEFSIITSYDADFDDPTTVVVEELPVVTISVLVGYDPILLTFLKWGDGGSTISITATGPYVLS